MTWFVENWFWIVTFIAFVAMHMFGHGGHGGHGGGGRRRSEGGNESDEAQRPASDKKSGGHRH